MLPSRFESDFVAKNTDKLTWGAAQAFYFGFGLDSGHSQATNKASVKLVGGQATNLQQEIQTALASKPLEVYYDTTTDVTTPAVKGDINYALKQMSAWINFGWFKCSELYRS